MADQASKDAAAKDRIIRHMNTDHQDSLSHYLRHYSRLSSRAASRPTLLDISFDSMTLRTKDGKEQTIPIDPPMTSWAEARARVIEMDRVAREALDISDIRITAYEPPTSVPHVLIMGSCLFAATVFCTMSRITPGTFFYDSILPYFPGGPEFFLWLAKKIVVPVVIVHSLEAWWLERSRLRKHGVERGSAVWWKWVASCFLEGAMSFRRIDAMIKRKRLEAEKAKH